MLIAARWIMVVALAGVSGCGGYSVSTRYELKESSQAATPVSGKRVGVLPFENTLKDGQVEWWGEGFGEMLTTDLAKVKGIEVIERRQLYKILEEIQFSRSGLADDAAIKQLGKMAGVDALLTGSYMAVEKQVRINARLLEVETGRILAASSVVGAKSDMLSMEHQLMSDLSSRLGWKWYEPRPQPAPKGALSIRQLKGLRLIAQGLSFTRQGQWDRAAEEFRRAIEVNPHSYEAHFNLAWIHQKQGRKEEAGASLSRAITFRHEPIDVDLLYGQPHDPWEYFQRTYEPFSP